MSTTFTGTLTTTQTLTASSFATINPVLVASAATISVANSSAIYGQAGGSVPAGGWTISNEGTVSGNLFGITLASSGLIFNGDVNHHARVTGNGSGIVINGSNGTLDNWGTVTGNNQDGILLAQGGEVFNNVGGSIQGKSTGVEVDNKPGTVANYGVISATASGSNGVLLNGGGYVTNTSGGTIKASGTGGIGVNITGPNGTVVDNGTISAGTYGVVFSSGTNVMEVQPSAVIYGTIKGGTAAGSDNILVFAAGDNETLSGLTPGIVAPGTTIGTNGTFHSGTNGDTTAFQYFGDIDVEAGATVTLAGNNTFGPGSGLLVSGGGTVVNAGGTLTANPTLSDSTMINTGTIVGAVYGIHSPNTLENYGTVTNASSTVAGGEAVSFSSGGYVENGLVTLNSNTYSNFAATLAGYSSGVDIEGTTGTVTNLGTITATSTTAGIGVWLSAGGTVNNGIDASSAHTNTSALIQAYDLGVLVSGGLGVVNNDGTISGNGDSAGVILLNGGTVNNGSTAVSSAYIVGEDIGVAILGGPGTVTNFCTIAADSTIGGIGVVLDTGTVVNGWSGDTNALITAQNFGIVAQGSAFVENYGKILGTNPTSSLGVYIEGPGTVVNKGSVSTLNSSGSVLGSNGLAAATISGANFGLATDGPASVNNLGTIVATATAGAGVNIMGNGTVNNGLFTVVNSFTTLSNNSALIEGSRVGVAVIGNMTLNNQGTILSNTYYGIGAVFGNGTITNGASGNSAALIKGHYGLIGAGNISLNNWGTVSADPAGGSGVQLFGNANITNAGLNAKIVGGSFGVLAGGSASVLNLGTIAGYYYKGVNGAGILVGGVTQPSSGIINNGSSNVSTIATSALIEGPQFGVVDFGTATVTNWGTIRAGTTVVSATHNSPGTLEQGAAVVMFNGTVVNGGIESSAAVINGESVGIFSPGPATITDYGTIIGGVDAVSLISGNNVVSLAGTGAAIGGVAYGVGGSIVGGSFPGSTNKLEFGQGAYVEMWGLVPSAFSGASTGILEANNSDEYATFSNFGTIQVDGNAPLTPGGTLGFFEDNTIATGTTLAVQAGGYAFVGSPSGNSYGYLLNKNLITIAHYGTFVVEDFSNLVNAHSISGDVTLAAGGFLTNTSTGTITGDAAVYVSGLGIAQCGPSDLHTLNAPLDPHLLGPSGLGYFAAVTNASGGVINGGSGQSIGVEDDSPGGFALLNSGTVTGGRYGVDLVGASDSGYGIVVNGLQFPSAGPVIVPSAVISGGAAGVYASAPGLFGIGPIVLNAGTIVGSYGIGVDLTNGGIVADSGTIIGNNGTAVAFGPDNFSALYLAPGYKLLGAGGAPGTVVTSNPFDSTLILGEGSFAGLQNAIGTISGIGVDGPGRFVFGNVYLSGFPASAEWSIVGANTIGAGYTLSGYGPTEAGVLDFAPNATLDIQGVMAQGFLFDQTEGELGVDLNMNGAGAQELILGQNVASQYRSTSGFYVAQGGTFVGDIEGVGAGDTIEIGGVALGSNPTATYRSNHSLVISSSNGTDYTFTNFHVQPGSTHFVVTKDPVTGYVKVVADPGPSVGTAGTISAGTVLSDPTSLDLPLNALVTPGLIGDAETITGFSTFTAHGTVSSDGHGGLIYTPTALASGADSFTFTATDQYGDTKNGTVNLTLNNTPAVPFSGTGGSTVNVGTNNAAVSLSGNLNTVGGIGSNGVVTVSGTSSGNNITLGNGNDTINLTGFSNSISLGSGNNIVTIAGAGGGNSVTVGAGADVITDTNSGADTFNLNGSNAFLAVSGAGALAFINGGNDQIALSGAAATSSTIKIGAGGGSAEITGFAAGDTVDLVGGLGFASAADVLSYVNNPSNSDGHGGTLLHYNNGAIDFIGVTPGHFTAANFSVA